MNFFQKKIKRKTKISFDFQDNIIKTENELLKWSFICYNEIDYKFIS